MRGGKGPEALRETGMNQAGTSPFNNVKVSSLNHGVTLRNAKATGFVKNPQVTTSLDDFTRAVR
eukprot:2042921-Heterocapsa_arctica.AAC.1